jgi:lysophospholipase
VIGRSAAIGGSISFIRSRDGAKLRTTSWESPPGIPRRGACAILNGHTEFIEKYAEVIDELGARGFAGASLDWRGQGGSGRALTDPLRAHVSGFAEYDADLRVFMAEVVAPLTRGHGSPLALAHSMGAHILLRALYTDPQMFAGAVMIAPMLWPRTEGYPDWLVRALASAHGRLGLAQSWVWGMGGRDPLLTRFDDNRVTSDRTRFDRTQNLLAANPALRLAGPSWGWLAAAYRSMAAMRAPGFAERITTPCLIFGAGRDRVVSTAAVRDFARRLPHATYIELADAEHEILMENDSIRVRFWTAFDGFVEELASNE